MIQVRILFSKLVFSRRRARARQGAQALSVRVSCGPGLPFVGSDDLQNFSLLHISRALLGRASTTRPGGTSVIIGKFFAILKSCQNFPFEIVSVDASTLASRVEHIA